jgi:diphthine synthase
MEDILFPAFFPVTYLNTVGCRNGMLTLVGLGLCDGTDITLRGKRAVDDAKHVYIERYTSLLQCDHATLERQLGRAITPLDRSAVESGIDAVLAQAVHAPVVILIIGDVFGATTHTDLFLRARERGIEAQVIHNASVMNAIGAIGLELYRFGKTISIPYWQEGFRPTSFLDGIKENLDRGLHTLCLLDIKADEGRFMSVLEGLEHLGMAEEERKFGIIHEATLVVGVARLGCPDQLIVAAPIALLRQREFGPSPHCIVIPGRLHHIEEEMLALWK